MRLWILLAASLAAHATDCVISDTLTNFDGTAFTGRVEIGLNNPASAQPLYTGSTTLTGWRRTVTVTAGAFAVTLVCTDSITPSGTSYNARFIPSQGAPWTETWTPATGTTTVRAMRSTTVPTPTATFQPGQIALAAGRLLYGSSTGVATSLAAGTNGHVLTLSGGYPTWAAAGGGVSSVFGRSGEVTATSGDYTAAQVTGAVAGSASLTTAGAVPYVSAPGTLNQDPTALFWDAANNRLGIGTNTPTMPLTFGASTGVKVEFYYAGGYNIGVESNEFRTSVGTAGFFTWRNAGYTGTEVMRLAPTTGNLLIGTTTDSNFKLDVATSGSAGTARFYDQTATTGVTTVVIRSGAGQSNNNSFTIVDSSGAVVLFGVNPGNQYITTTLDLGNGGRNAEIRATGFSSGSGTGYRFSSTAASNGTIDLALFRNAAGVAEVNNGTAGTFRDLRVRDLITTLATPASSTAACTAGTWEADADYIYICTSTNNWRRVALTTF